MPRVGKNFRQKNYSAKDGIDEPNGYNIYDGISAVPQNRKFSEFSLNHSAEEKNGPYSVPLNRKRSKLSNICFESYRGKTENQLRIPFRGKNIEK